MITLIGNNITNQPEKPYRGDKKKFREESIELHATRCAICDTEGNATELYPPNFDLQAFNPAVFSARRLPDRIHGRMVKCKSCGLVRTDPIADPELLAQLYAQSTFDYDEEVANLKCTYGNYLARLAEYGATKGNLLEIGCGNGFFLEEALARGYTTVRGIEPSEAALALASSLVRPFIINDIMRPGLLAPEQFDVICMFQVLDHISDPAALLAECFKVLKAGGLMLSITHNIEAVSARWLKERSPIIDLEHTYLYGPATVSRIFAAVGFQVKKVDLVYNRYSLHYLTRLLPLPRALKQALLSFLKGNAVGNIRVSVPLGNMYLVAQKPV